MNGRRLRIITGLGLSLAMGAGEFAFGQSCLTSTAAQPITINPGFDTDDEWSPELVTDGLGTWFATWYSYNDLGGTIGTDSDILFSRSVDNGATWSTAAPFNANAASHSGRDEFLRMAADGLGNWVAVWQSEDDLDATIGTDFDILFTRSDDNGLTWSPIAVDIAQDRGTPASLRSLVVEEVGLEPVEDLRQPDGPGGGLDSDIAGLGDELADGVVELLVEALRIEGLLRQPRTTDRGTVECRVHPGVHEVTSSNLPSTHSPLPARDRARP